MRMLVAALFLVLPASRPSIPGIEPLKPAPTLDRATVDLGRALYHDTLLSKNNAVSCASCHPVDKGGTTAEAFTRLGFNGKPVSFNTPTTFNATLQSVQGWKADAQSVVELMERPFFRASCMGNDNWTQLIEQIQPKYQGITKDRVNDALVEYMQHITPRGAPVDRYLQGDARALSSDAREGAKLFTTIGCVACHNGAGVGGDMTTRFGQTVTDPYATRQQCDDGSYCWDCGCKPSTVRDVDRGIANDYRFRVPSLRNVALTAPYFHDGSARTLDEAVRVMARLQLGRTLSDDEAKKLVAFLDGLTAPLPPNEIRLAARARR